MRTLFTTFIVMALCLSCAPQLSMPEVDIPSKYLYGDIATVDSVGGEWWQIYGDEVLDSLERLAIRQNRDVAVAASRIESARYNLSVARSAFLPSINAEVSAESEYTTPEGETHEFVLQPTVSWSVSLFGALRNTQREARAQMLSTVWAYRGVMLSLSKEVATAYFTILQYSRSLEIAERTHLLRVESAALIDSLARYGMSTGLELDQANSLVYTAAADVEQYSRALAQAQLSLATLLGETPEILSDKTPLEQLSLESIPQAIPAGIPSDLLRRRPDIMESYYELQAASARVGIARSNRFPSISITGSGGLFGSTVKELFEDGHWKWGATGGLAQPLFNFGGLRNREKMARAAYDEARLEYEQTLLNALEEVESALVAIATYRAQMERYAQYVKANGRIAELTKSLYQAGMSDYLDVISTEQTWYESQLQLVGLVAQQYINYADLVMALGDGWQDVDGI